MTLAEKRSPLLVSRFRRPRQQWQGNLNSATVTDHSLIRNGQRSMRPIYWGIIWFFIGMVGWVFFSVIVGIGTAFGGQAPSSLWALMYLFGIAFYFSLPCQGILPVAVSASSTRPDDKVLLARRQMGPRPEAGRWLVENTEMTVGRTRCSHSIIR